MVSGLVSGEADAISALVTGDVNAGDVTSYMRVIELVSGWFLARHTSPISQPTSICCTAEECSL
jgi:hypothetical protein